MSEMQPKAKLKKKKPVKKTKPTKSKGTKGSKSTQSELNQRVTEVQDLLMDGHTRSYIIQCGSKWNVSVRTIDEYISKATEIIKEVNKLTVQENLSIIVNNLWITFRKARIANEFGEQRQILMAIAKLKGLEQVTINHIIDDKRELQDLSNEELDSILAQETMQH